jgi:hypothetical protein
LQVFQQLFFLFGVRFALGQLDIRLDVPSESGEFRVGGALIFGSLAILQYALRFFLIVPEVGVGDSFFERLQANAIRFRVKDSS